MLRANASTIPVNYVQIIPPQAEWCLNIVWVPGIRRQRRALRTRGTNIKTIFIKTQAVKGLRGENAYTKVCNFLRALFPLCLNCGSLRLALACCGSLRVAVARCSSSHSDQYNPFNNIFIFFVTFLYFWKNLNILKKLVKSKYLEWLRYFSSKRRKSTYSYPVPS